MKRGVDKHQERRSEQLRRSPERAAAPRPTAAIRRVVDEPLAEGAIAGAFSRPAMQEALRLGTGAAAGPLPYLAAIQRSFGRHDVSDVVAHVGEAATEAAVGVGAAGFASGKHVVFAGEPSLHTAAHEAAHTIQQRAGLQLASGVGDPGDRHERHADAVADRVIQGLSAEPLLDAYVGGAAWASAEGTVVQRRELTAKLPTKVYRREGGSYSRQVNDKIDAFNKRQRQRETPEALLKLLIEIEEMAKTRSRGAKRERAEAVLRDLHDQRVALLSLIVRDKLEVFEEHKVQRATHSVLLGLLDDLEESARNLVRESAGERGKDVLLPLFNDRATLQLPTEGYAVQRPIGEGPKAGMELEWGSVMWIDVQRAREGTNVSKRFLNELMTDASAAKRSFTADQPRLIPSDYAKRKVLFAAPKGTWEGQADSTLARGANLEIVTKPLTKEEWLSEAAHEDAQAMVAFAEKLAALPPFVLRSPADLLPGLQIVVPTARFFRHTDAREQGQMTRASPLKDATEPAPQWWPLGMDWRAATIVKKVVSALERPRYMGQNPKGSFGGVIPKLSVATVLGQPERPLNEEARRDFVLAMAALCEVKEARLRSTSPMPLVLASKQNSQHMALEDTTFSWEEFFLGLLEGRDLVANWAGTAFGGKEDLGYGQLRDDSLAQGWTIEEVRQGEGIDDLSARNYLERGRLWAQGIPGN